MSLESLSLYPNLGNIYEKKSFSFLGSLSNVKSLALSLPSQDYNFLKNMDAIETLYLAHATSFSDLNLISSKKIKILNLHGSGVTDFKSLAGFLNLKKVVLPSKQDGTTLANCPLLKELDKKGVVIKEVLPWDSNQASELSTCLNQ